MKVLLTGGSGFLGRHLLPLLLKQGHSVTVLARNPHAGHMPDANGQLHYLTADIYADQLPADLGDHDAVIHLAWSGLPNYNALYHFERNLPADYGFLKSLIGLGIKHILITGTCFEYGLQEGCLSEILPCQPTTAYALAKDCLRRFLQQLQLQQAFRLQWARLFYMYGPGQHPGSLLAQLDNAIDSGEHVFNMSGGAQLRDYLPVNEVAAQLSTLFKHTDYDGIINICSGKPISVRELVERHLLQRGVNIDLNLGYYGYPQYEPMAFWGDNRKFTQLCRPEPSANIDSR